MEQMSTRRGRTRSSARNEPRQGQEDQMQEVIVAPSLVTNEKGKKMAQAVRSIEFVEKFVFGDGFENAKGHEVQT